MDVIFQREKKPWHAYHNQSAADIQTRMNEMRAHKSRMCGLYGYQSGGTDRYAAVFVDRDMHDWQGFVGMSTGDHQNRMRAMQAAGYRLVNQSVHTVGGQRRFTALYDREKPHDWSAQLDLDGAAYQAAFGANVRQKRTLGDLDVDTVERQPRFFPVWIENRTKSDQAHHGMDSDSYHAALQACEAQRMESRILVGYQEGNAMRFAGYWAR